MGHATQNKIVSFIWLIPDDCLRNWFGANVARIIDPRLEVNLPDTSGKTVYRFGCARRTSLSGGGDRIRP